MDLVKDIAELKTLLGSNWLLMVTATTVIWLMVTRLAETNEAVRKLLGPLGRRIMTGYNRRQAKYRVDVTQEAKLLAVELLPKVIPADYNTVKTQLTNVIERVEDLEIQNTALRGFVIYDESWHFKHALQLVKSGVEPLPEVSKHISWDTFIEKWKLGWRPDIEV